MTPIAPASFGRLERIGAAISPRWGMERLRAKMTMSALEAGGYITPGSSRRAMRGWNPFAQSADADTILKQEPSRAACRDLVMNCPVAGAALDRESTNVVGFGLSHQARIDRDIIGLGDDEADAWERACEREFNLFARNCDITRTSTFGELQKMALYNASLSGDVFVLLPFLAPTSETPYGLRLKLVEADYVRNPDMALDSTRCAGGVETDANGAPAFYHFWTPPADTALTMETFGMGGTSTKVPAFGEFSGRRNVLHLYHKLRPGQRRGMPMLAPVVEILKQLSRLTEAELMASVVTSFFTVFLKTQPGLGSPLAPAFPEGSTGTAIAAAERNSVLEMGNGTILELMDNQDVDIADPKRPNQAFRPFYEAIVQQIGARIEIPYEQLMLYFSSSYSAARGAIEEAWKFYRRRRQWLIDKLCQPVKEAWLTEAVAIGRIRAPGFFEEPLLRQAWCGSYWGGPGKGQLNPYQETQAAAARIDNYLSTREDEYTAIHGGADFTGFVNRRARENKLLQSRGLPLNAAEAKAAPAAPDPSTTTQDDGGDKTNEDDNGGKTPPSPDDTGA